MIEGKRVVITGGAGFLGKQLAVKLCKRNEVFIPRSTVYDLRKAEDANRIFQDFPNVDIVIHAACDIGGIGYSSKNPGSMFYNNILINTNALHASYQAGVRKFAGIGSVCEYPSDAPVPFCEKDIWNGYPVVENDAYGMTKRMLLMHGNLYRRQYGFRAIHLLFGNIYGPGESFRQSDSHVIPSLIRRIIRAKEQRKDFVDVWGTGDEGRDFLYINDAADAVLLAAECYDKEEPVNIGSGREITIRELAELIKKLAGYDGQFHYLNNGLGGQKRRKMNAARASEEFGFRACVELENGIQNMIHYYMENKENLEQDV